MDTATLQTQIPLPWQQIQWRRLLRQAAENKLAHAYLFSGPSGTGKTLFVRQLTAYLLCASVQAEQPCGHCRSCQTLAGGVHPDRLAIEPEEGSRDIKIEQVRALSEFAARTSHAGGRRVITLSHAHRLNVSAANALLKTLEEPGAATVLILVTDLPGFLPATIRSRCQRLQFPAPKLDLAERWLRQHVTGEFDATALLAVADCRPLTALQLAESDAMVDRQEFLQALSQVVTGQGSPLPLVKQAMALGDVAAVEYLLASSTILLKAQLTDDASAVEQHGLGRLYATLQQDPAPLPRARRLMQLYQDALQARQQLLSGSNPNAQLVLETLLWRWSQLFAR